MVLALLAFLGGVLTILSPCVLPVLPFVFARSEQPFARSTLPLLLGMAATFAGIATLAAVGGAWAVRLNTAGRFIALFVLAVLGITLLSRRAADYFARPFVAFGNRLSQAAGHNAAPSIVQSALLGVALGFLWAPCAGPILGLILTGAAINGPSTATTTLLFAYALGATVSLAAAVLLGGRVFAALRQFARRRRMDPARPRRRRAARGRRHRARLGHGHPDSPVIRQHESHRAGAARPAPRRRRSGEPIRVRSRARRPTRSCRSKANCRRSPAPRAGSTRSR